MQLLQTYLFTIFVTTIYCEINITDFFTLLSNSSPQKQLYMYNNSARFFEIDYTPPESDFHKVSHKLQFEIGKSTDDEKTFMKIKFPTLDKYLCWKNKSQTGGVIGCADGNSDETGWVFDNNGSGNEYKITNGDYCLTLGTKDTKIKNSYYVKTEKCDNKRKKEQLFIAHKLPESDDSINVKKEELEIAKKSDTDSSINELGKSADVIVKPEAPDVHIVQVVMPETVGYIPQKPIVDHRFDNLTRKMNEIALNQCDSYKGGKCPLPR